MRSDRPINVLHLRDTYEIGGPGKTIIETFRAIDSARFRLHLGIFLIGNEKPDSPFASAAKAVGLPLHSISGRNRYDPRLVHGVRDLVSRHEVDVIHAHEVKSDVVTYFASRMSRAAAVTTLHGWIGNSPRQRAMIRLDRQVVKRFDLAIAVSSRIRDQMLSAGMGRDRIHVLHNAIVIDNYRRSSVKPRLPPPLDETVSGPVIVCVGRLSPEKGPADLLESLAIVASRGLRVTTLFAGDGPQRTELEQLAAARGLTDSVLFLGHISAPAKLIEAADLLVLPSHTEGLPNVILESLTLGTPVLATRVGGTPEIVTDGESGRLVPPRSPAVLADALCEFLRDPTPWLAMATRGGALVAKEFDFRSRTAKLQSLYEEVLERRNK